MNPFATVGSDTVRDLSETQYRSPPSSKSPAQPSAEPQPLPTPTHDKVNQLFSPASVETNSVGASLEKKVSLAAKTDNPENYEHNPVIQDLVQFLKCSPTAWQAVEQIRSRLERSGFVHLKEDETWDLNFGGKYYTTRNGSSLIAFVLPTDTPVSATILGAHTDSPGLKLKPNSDMKSENYSLLATQIYGGPILPSWFNRPLGIAGQCYYAEPDGTVKHLSVDIRRPIATIPQLAVHLNRELRTKVDLNPQKELNAVVSFDSQLDSKASFIETLIQEEYGVKPLPGFELFLVPSKNPSCGGQASRCFPARGSITCWDATLRWLLCRILRFLQPKGLSK